MRSELSDKYGAGYAVAVVPQTHKPIMCKDFSFSDLLQDEWAMGKQKKETSRERTNSEMNRDHMSRIALVYRETPSVRNTEWAFNVNINIL